MLSRLTQELWELRPYSDQGPTWKCPAPKATGEFSAVPLAGNVTNTEKEFPIRKSFIRANLSSVGPGSYTVELQARPFDSKNFATITDTPTPAATILVGSGTDGKWISPPFMGFNMAAGDAETFAREVELLKTDAIRCAQQAKVAVSASDVGIPGSIGNALSHALTLGTGVRTESIGHGAQIRYDSVNNGDNHLPSLGLSALIVIGTGVLLTHRLLKALGVIGDD